MCSITLIIPCFNEEKTIERCVQSSLDQTCTFDEIIVVDDASTDKSPEILEKFKEKITVIRNKKNKGAKSYALEEGFKHIKTTWFVTTDADTYLDKHFLEELRKYFFDEEVVAVSGYIKSQKGNWLTSIRDLEYFIAQSVHKKAQNIINAFLVIPGCAAAYNTEFFRKNIGFTHKTCAEDMEFTYKINLHRKRIRYTEKAIVHTQDPSDLGSYIKQLRRWYKGSWQNFFAHFRNLNRTLYSFELALSYFEALFLSLAFFIMALINIKGFFIMIALQLCFYFIFALVNAYKYKKARILIYVFLTPIVFGINSYLFIEQFFASMSKNKTTKWVSPRRT